MAIQTHPALTEAEFDTFVDLPENADRIFEYIAGRAVEVPSNPFASKLAGIILGEIYIWLKANDIGHLTGADGGYRVDGERYAPDVAFISYDKQDELTGKGYNPVPPDLAVEVISNPDNAQEQEDLRTKISHYMVAGTVVWVVDFAKRRVEIHEPGKSLRYVTEDGALDGGEVLPGFTLQVADIFKKGK